MKTHLLLSTAVVALLGASSAFAGSNTVYLNQLDSSQNASITQSGSSNTVGYSWRNFVQQNGGLSGHNALVINQSGNNNWVARDAQGYQSGTSNTANISQAGYGSDVELQQSGTENGNGYIAYNNGGAYNSVFQDASSNSSKASVVQSGYRNGFDIVQGGYGNNTSLTQNNNGGVAYIRQGTAGSYYDQSSNRGTPTGGNNNAITVNQTTDYANYVVAIQGNGDSNTATLTQQGDGLRVNSWQQGSSNAVSSTQVGYYSTAVFNQFGTLNSATSNQGNYASANIYQNGYGNQSIGSQYGGAGSNYLNVATVSQSGDNNTANYAQNGYSNTVSVTQTGNWNNSVTSQTGTGHVANIVQN
jgi:hypothetical protein